MDTAIRDMERLEERGVSDGLVRRVGVSGLALVLAVALLVGVGMMVGDTGEVSADTDALDSLDRAAGLAQAREAQDPVADAPEVDPRTLTFPEALVDPEDAVVGDGRAEVAAAFAAAEAELAYPDPIGAWEDGPPPATPPQNTTLPSSLPAAVAAGPEAEILVRTASRDPLVAEALPAPSTSPPAAPGKEGKYTLQVISYKTHAEAETFAASLRARGHAAFVVAADIPERGRHYRVRIGPFERLSEVNAYRHDFEERERMNTYVVKRAD